MIASKDIAKKHKNVGQVDLDLLLVQSVHYHAWNLILLSYELYDLKPCIKPYHSIAQAISLAILWPYIPIQYIEPILYRWKNVIFNPVVWVKVRL